MSRWEPNARGRLERAALELYAERGFDQTTVAEIARRAGLRERSFFRYFPDKREVLFWGQDALREAYANAIANAPAAAAPIDAVAAGLNAAAAILDGRHGLARQRAVIIAATPELQERELLKRATLASAIADALRRRGVTDLTASLAAETAIAIFKVAYARWVDQCDEEDFGTFIVDALDHLKAMTAGQQGASSAGE